MSYFDAGGCVLGPAIFIAFAYAGRSDPPDISARVREVVDRAAGAQSTGSTRVAPQFTEKLLSGAATTALGFPIRAESKHQPRT